MAVERNGHYPDEIEIGSSDNLMGVVDRLLLEDHPDKIATAAALKEDERQALWLLMDGLTIDQTASQIGNSHRGTKNSARAAFKGIALYYENINDPI